MNNERANNTRDPRWNSYVDMPGEPDAFRDRMLGRLYLKPDVHEDIRNSFRVVKQLIEYSYYEYEFYDVASSKALTILEMAFRIRYREIVNREWGTRPLKQLFEWIDSQGLLETSSHEYYNRIRESRNRLMHPEHYWYMGAFMNTHVHEMLDLVNDLYEDVQKRIERKNINKALTEHFDQLADQGAIISCDGQPFCTAFRLWVGFVNNKNPLPTITLYAKPVFEIPTDIKPGHATSSIYAHEIVLNNTTWQENFIQGIDAEGRLVEINSISEPTGQMQYREWKAAYDNYSSISWYHRLLSAEISHTCCTLRTNFHTI
jgi:hypothetical protein